MKPAIRNMACLALLFSACSNLPEPEGPPAASTAAPVPAAQVATPPSAAFDPVGSFDFAAEFQGQSQPGVITIARGSDGQLGAILVGGNGEQLPASAVTVEGRKVTITATIPGGPEIVMALTFETNDKFAGSLNVQGMSGTVAGTRTKA